MHNTKKLSTNDVGNSGLTKHKNIPQMQNIILTKITALQTLCLSGCLLGGPHHWGEVTWAEGHRAEAVPKRNRDTSAGEESLPSGLGGRKETQLHSGKQKNPEEKNPHQSQLFFRQNKVTFVLVFAIQTEHLVDQQILITRLRSNHAVSTDGSSGVSVDAGVSRTSDRRAYSVPLIGHNCRYGPIRRVCSCLSHLCPY